MTEAKILAELESINAKIEALLKIVVSGAMDASPVKRHYMVKRNTDILNEFIGDSEKVIELNELAERIKAVDTEA